MVTPPAADAGDSREAVTHDECQVTEQASHVV